MLRLVPDHIKINKLCKHGAKKCPFLIKYAPDRYKTQECVMKLLFSKMVGF